MLDFLKELGISEETINYINENNDSNIVFDVDCNKTECVKIIEYLKGIGIKNIENILKYELQIFYKDEFRIKQIFNKYNNLDELVEAINEDYTIIEKI